MAEVATVTLSAATLPLPPPQSCRKHTCDDDDDDTDTDHNDLSTTAATTTTAAAALERILSIQRTKNICISSVETMTPLPYHHDHHHRPISTPSQQQQQPRRRCSIITRPKQPQTQQLYSLRIVNNLRHFYGIILLVLLTMNDRNSLSSSSHIRLYVQAFSVSTTTNTKTCSDHHHRRCYHLRSNTFSQHHQRSLQRMVHLPKNRKNNHDASRSIPTTTATTLPMTLKSNPFETDSPNSNDDSSSQPQPQIPIISPVNDSTTNMATTTLSGSTSTTAALTTGLNVTPTTITSSGTNSNPIKSSNNNNNNNNNNPPFLVTLDDATKYSYTEAIQRTIGWVSAAIIFGTTLWITNDATTGEEFFAGYLVEQSLSVDNLFVFLLLFEYFQVPIQYQDRVLNWGIYGAIVMRSIMIGLGSVALQQFHFILLVFAAILVYSSVSFFLQPNDDEETKEDPSQNYIVQFSRAVFPSTDTFDEDRFFTMVDGIRMATPLFICMVAVEISDVVFAIDSIPAVFGVTENPLIVFSSNIFAIMGLRSLYTILSKAATDLKYLEPAVALVLGFIGSKMIAEYMDFIIPTNIALLVVASVLSTGIGLSIWEQQQQQHESTKEE